MTDNQASSPDAARRRFLMAAAVSGASLALPAQAAEPGSAPTAGPIKGRPKRPSRRQACGRDRRRERDRPGYCRRDGGEWCRCRAGRYLRTNQHRVQRQACDAGRPGRDGASGEGARTSLHAHPGGYSRTLPGCARLPSRPNRNTATSTSWSPTRRSSGGRACSRWTTPIGATSSITI